MGKDEEKSTKGKVVIKKSHFIIYIVIIISIIVALGLTAGLISQSATSCEDVIEKSTTTTPSFSSTTLAPTDVPNGPWSDIRLPSSLIPFHYNVDLQPDLTPVSSGFYLFNGTSEVYFTAMDKTNTIVIHSNKLNYTHIKAWSDKNKELPIKKYWLYEANQYLVVELEEPLSKGSNYSLSTQFVGELANDLAGLYRSAYIDSSGNEIWIAVTQMHPTNTRKTFPCFDEPALKATFDISLWHKDPNFALSNMPVDKTLNEAGDWKRTTFQRTLPMCTYLLVFVICDFNYTNAFTSSVPPIQTKIYARPEQVSNGNVDYAKNITPTILDYYTDYFSVLYPLPKSDQAAIPDFAFNAMENWGLVMYRETALLYNPLINSASNKQRVGQVIAHELSHQWFGNLISPLWFDEAWLSEGFATFIEYLGVDYVEPTWQIMDQFVVLDLHAAMSVDSLTTSRPIVAENVSTPAQISGMFDDISYSKGACIIRMINQFTGEEAFRLGLKNYLEEYAYGSVDHKQLFRFWEVAVSITPGANNPPNGFVDAMNTWVLQMGFPTINVNRHPSKTDAVVVTQERFLLDPKADMEEPESPYNYEWTVPFWYHRKNEINKTLLWLEAGKAHEISLPTTDYIIGNYEVFGYYRVNYDEEIWQKITEQLNDDFSVINVKSRAQIVDDAFNLARAGKLSYQIALSLTEFLREDFEYVPWESALDVMAYLDLVLGRSQVYGAYSKYLLYLVQPLYDKLTWNDEGEHLEHFQRINAIQVACGYGDKNCTAEAVDRFQQWKNNPEVNNITPNLRSTVYCQAIANSGDEEWDFLWSKYQNESDSQEKSKLQYALTCSRTPWIIRRFLDRTMDSTLVKKQDASGIFEDLCYNEHARDITWDFLRQEWDYVYEVYGTGLFSLSGIIESCTSHFSTEFELEELQTFKEENSDKLGSGLRAVEQSIEKTITNIQWRNDNEETVHEWLLQKLANL